MINSILKEALEFKEKIKKIKNQNTPEGFTWYGYGTLDNLWLVDQLLSDNSKEKLYDFKGKLIADIGAADGDLGQFLAENGAESRCDRLVFNQLERIKGRKILK